VRYYYYYYYCYFYSHCVCFIARVRTTSPISRKRGQIITREYNIIVCTGCVLWCACVRECAFKSAQVSARKLWRIIFIILYIFFSVLEGVRPQWSDELWWLFSRCSHYRGRSYAWSRMTHILLHDAVGRQKKNSNNNNDKREKRK